MQGRFKKVDEMKGYINKDLFAPYEPVDENTLVGCKKCNNTWYEKHTFTTAVRINGVGYFYDYCDKCKDVKNSHNGTGI